MRRYPFYAYPNFLYAPAAEASYHRGPHHPFRPASSTTPSPPPASGPRSVINIPVFDSAPSRPPTTPPAPALCPSAAATTIQSRFRGFCVRRHRPLLHLRSIANARKKLEELQSELDSPGFPLKLRASEKERLRFSESVMAVILRLDAIEGSIAEVRSQRKEATKMAIKLQDAIDAILMWRDEIDDLEPCTGGPNSSDVCMADDDDDSVLCDEESEETAGLRPDDKVGHAGVHAASNEATIDANTMQEGSTGVAEQGMPNLDNSDAMDIVDGIDSPLPSLEANDAAQQVEAGSKSGFSESVPPVKPLEGMDIAEQGMSHVAGEDVGSDATRGAEEEVNNGIYALHLEARNKHMQGNAPLVAKVDQDNIKVAHPGSAKGAFSEAPYHVVQEIDEQDVELCPGTPTADDHPHFSNAAHHAVQSTAHDTLTEGNCPPSDGPSSPTLHRDGYENPSDEAYETPSDEVNPCDEARAPSSTLSSMAGTPSPPPDGALLQQLSEDCRQLKSLVGKLIMQNKAQGKVLCALGRRLELLEDQQQLNCQRNQQQTREKRKLKKGGKRSVKCRNSE